MTERTDKLMHDMGRSNFVAKSKAKWNAKQAHRVRPVIAPGQKKLVLVSAASSAANKSREAIYKRQMAATEAEYAREVRAHRERVS